MYKLTTQHFIIAFILLFATIIIFKNDIVRIINTLGGAEHFQECPINTNTQISFENWDFDM